MFHPQKKTFWDTENIVSLLIKKMFSYQRVQKNKNFLRYPTEERLNQNSAYKTQNNKLNVNFTQVFNMKPLLFKGWVVDPFECCAF